MSELYYRIPLKLIAAQGKNFATRTPVSIDRFTRDIVSLMNPRPLILGLSNLPQSARFILAPNHFQRKGMWILHPAAALTHAIREYYGPGDPPVRWVVTANWPRIKLGPLSFRSPGDLLLPRVADIWSCYPVSFNGTNPGYTAKGLRTILREAPRSTRPLGLFPEGVAGKAGRLSDPLPGVDRLILHLARSGVPVVPVSLAATDRLVVRFGPLISEPELLHAQNAAKLVMERIGELT